MCVERMTMPSPESSESRFRKRTRSSGSRPAVGSSTIKSCGSLSKALRNADALAHATRKSTERTIATGGQIGHGEKFVGGATRRGRFNPFDGRREFHTFKYTTLPGNT